jgi:membrane protease YdiL (CAAX protease family)
VKQLSNNNKPIVKIAALFYCTMFVISLLWAAISDIPFSFSFKNNYLFFMSILLTLIITAMTILFSVYVKKYSRWASLLEAAIYNVFGPLEKSTIAFLALLSSVGEEFFFRGVLQPEIGYIFTSIIFGSIHFIPQKVFLPWTIFAIIMGFILGWLYLYSDNLIFPIITHGAINYINLTRICSHKAKVSEEVS